MKTSEVEALVAAVVTDAEMDVSGEDCNFEMKVISEQFAGMNTMQRQKLVLSSLQEPLQSGALHAISIQAYTPDEFAEKQNTYLVQLES